MNLKEKIRAKDQQIEALDLDNRHLIIKIQEAQEANSEACIAVKNLILKIVAETREETRAGLLAATDDLVIRLAAADIHLSLEH